MHKLYRGYATQAEIDEQYDVEAQVPDFTIYAKHYIGESQRAREHLKCELDVRYGATLDETLDIFYADKPNAPVFVFIHGGGWRALSSKEFSCVALGLVPLGITTVVVNYSVAPKVAIDEITRQARSSVAWVLSNIGRYGGDPSRVVLGGHSAGGHLSAMCLQTPWKDEYGFTNNDPLVGAVLVSGLYDLEPLRFSSLQPQMQLDDGVIRRNSPMFSIRACATPALITWGTEEPSEFGRHSEDFNANWIAAGNRSKRVPQPGLNHFDVLYGFEDSQSLLCQWVAQAARR
jgi:arylformamidase